MENNFEPTLENIFSFFECHEHINSPIEGDAFYYLLINLLKENNPDISWVGLYVKDPNSDYLILGPYIGPLPCERINITNGVCGKCYRENSIQLVDDVNALPYHIACSSLTQSELVLPIRNSNNVVAVLDIDSNKPAAFTKEYASKIEELLQLIEQKISK
ncbi:MAG: GAF domain-containing protein [Bacilli bacterium]|nr:GAF domain-containing protein [Bacilli bacterium]